MHHHHGIGGSLFFFVCLALCCLAVGPALVQAAEYRPGEVLVQFRDPCRSTALVAYQNRPGMRRQRALRNGRLLQLGLPDDLSVAQAVAELSEDPEVLFVEPNYIVRSQSMPDDPYFNLQWGLYNSGQMVAGYVGTAGKDIDAPSAWDLSREGEEIVVAVVDTGCTLNHPDLEQRIWINQNEIADNFIDDDHNGFVDDCLGWDMVDDDNAPWDPSGHGTHVAGIIAAQSDNALGVSGAAPKARIMPVRMMDAFDQGTVADAIAAIEYALDQGARIINCSWGSTGHSTALKNTMAAADALFVCAAGNTGSNNDAVGFYPASFDLDNVLSVAAVDQMDQLAWFSNYGRQSVDVAAPGIRIYSLNVDHHTLWQDRFDFQGLAGWTTGGTGDAWAVRQPPLSPGESALSFTDGDTYAPETDTWAQMPVFDLNGLGAAQLTFKVKGATQALKDVLAVEASRDGNAWQKQPVYYGGNLQYNGISGSMPYWTRVVVDLGAYDGAPRVFVRLHFRSDAELSDLGFYVDDLNLRASTGGEAYQFMSGTSMAAAFVSGTGALVLSLNAGYSGSELKNIILDSVDLNQALGSRLISGGRVNAYNAMTLLQDLSRSPPSGQSGGSQGGGCFVNALRN